MRFPGQIGKTKVQVINENFTNAGIYVWKLPTGKYFTDGEGNALSIESMKGDIAQIAKLKQAAAYYGEPDGEPYFFAGLGRVTDEEYSEQKQRMAEGLIPNLNDLGAVQAAKDTIAKYGATD